MRPSGTRRSRRSAGIVGPRAAHRRLNLGFTLAEVLVSFALIAVLAAVTVPAMRGRLQDGYEDALVSELDNLSAAITAYRQDVGKYPPRLDYLFQLPPGTKKDRCGVTLSTTAVANWRGPYVTREIDNYQFYFIAQKDSMEDSIYKSTSPVGLALNIYGTDTLTAHNLDLRIDGSNFTTAGQIQWSQQAPQGDVKLTYIIPTSGSC